MAITSGRSLLIKVAGTTVANVRTKSVASAKGPIDISTDDDAGFVTLLTGAVATKQITITVSGLTDDPEFFTEAMDPTSDGMMTNVTAVMAQGTFAGDMFLTNYVETGEYQGNYTFDATLVSSDAWTIT